MGKQGDLPEAGHKMGRWIGGMVVDGVGWDVMMGNLVQEAAVVGQGGA